MFSSFVRLYPLTRIALLSFFVSAMALASDATVPYQVQTGDNLHSISAKLLNKTSDWQELAKLNRISDPNYLVPGSTVLLPVKLLRGVPQSAQVLYVRGDVKIIAGAHKGQALQKGSQLGENDVVVASANGWLGLQLQDGSQMYVSPNSQFSLTRLRDVPQAQVKQTDVNLKRGRVDFAVEPQSSGSRFEVKTPLAVTGVRGTRFGVGLSDDASNTLTDLLEGKVVFTPSKADETALAAGNGIVLNRGNTPQVRPLLAAPQLSTPLARIDALPFTIAITPDEQAVRYRVQLEQAAPPHDIVWQNESATARIDPQSAGLSIADGQYILRLRAIDSVGLIGNEQTSPVLIKTTPQAPLIQNPVQSQHVPSGAVTLLCAGDTDAKGYLFEHSTQKDFASNTQQYIQQDTTCRWTATIKEIGSYFWRVATLEATANGQFERGPFSQINEFIVVPAPVAPEVDVITGEQLRVQWAGETGSQYQLQVAREPDFAVLALDLNLSEASAVLDIPYGCFSYYLRLKTTNQYGMSSDFSKARRLNTPKVICNRDGNAIVDGQNRPARGSN